MKIVIIGAAAFDSFEFHLCDEFTYQGHDCVIVDFNYLIGTKLGFPLTRFSENFDEYISNQAVNRALDYGPDLIICTYRNINPKAITRIRQSKVTVIHINPDALINLQSQQVLASSYDHYFVKDPFMFRFMKDKLDLKVTLYNEAFNPRVHKPAKGDRSFIEKQVNIDVLSFGTMYPYRTRMLRQLISSGLNLTIYGVGAKYPDEIVEKYFKRAQIVGDRKSEIIYGSKIVFNNLHYAEIESVNNKFFEINGIGGFQICDYKPILHDLLPVDPELVSFTSIDEAIHKMRYYLNKPKERYEISNKINKHFLEHYTYKNLINKIIDQID